MGNHRRPSAQGTNTQAEASGLRVEAEQSRVALRFDLHLAGGAGRIAGRTSVSPELGLLYGRYARAFGQGDPGLCGINALTGVGA